MRGLWMWKWGEKEMITVITICLNAEGVIEDTMRTVITQADMEIEYIIKDGCSNDATNEKIKAVIEKCDNPAIQFKHIVSKDAGIYDAMNQAIEQAHGDWIIFMNAGDYFYNKYVLRDASIYFDSDAEVLYGNTLYTMREGYRFPQIHEVLTIREYFNLGHQSCLIRTTLINNYLFDARYKIAGDYEQLRRIFKDGHKFMHINMIVSICNREGISCQKSNLHFDEVYRIQHEGILEKNIDYQKKLLFWNLKKILATLFPNWESYRYCKNSMKRINVRYEP